MPRSCKKCDGSGECHNEYHGIVSRTNIFDSDNQCPACGEPAGSPGNCSACGGTGTYDDDDDDDGGEYE